MLKVLTLASVFPNVEEPEHGIFVYSRVSALAKRLPVTVIAPVPLIDYARRRVRFRRMRNFEERGERLTILRPRWAYPPGGGPLNASLLARQLTPLIRKLQRKTHFDVIDAHFGHPEGTAAALLARTFQIPFVVTIRGSEMMHARYPDRREALGEMLRNAAAIIAVSERLRDFAIELGAEPAKTKVVPNGIDISIFHPRDREECRRKHGIALSARVVLTAGHLIQPKGHHHVIEALKNLPSETVHLIAGGQGRREPFGSELERRAAALGPGRVRFAGHVAPAVLAELMCAADVFCLASDREGWPNVVNEALACGTPVVAFDVGAVPQLISSPDYGVIVPAGDAAALTAALRNALSRSWDRDEISQRGSSRSWDAVGEEVAGLLEALFRTSTTHSL